MTTAYPIQHHTRVCAATGRALQPGERYYSVLLVEAGQFARKDYSAEGWHGAPAEALAFWSGKVPEADPKRRLVVDDELLMNCFERLAEETDSSRIQFRYVVALLLLRRKRLKFDDLRRDGAQEFLKLKCSKSGQMFEVLDPHMAEADMMRVQDEVMKILGWE
ncbi:MAG TPA: hypothetical protein VGZ47_09000 [Gemmataceae bacterium]|jgi:hypothetical protein|nr:hypothetical protein [Gemmataceae bacterium]